MTLLSPWLCATYLVILTIWLYYPSLKGPFLFDDFALWKRCHHYIAPEPPSLVEDVVASFQQPMTGVWHDRPLTWVTYYLDAKYSGLVARGWRATNLTIHVLAVLGTFTVLYQKFAIFPALFGALIFACHPLGTNAVAYISGRSSLLCSMLLIWALYGFIAGNWAGSLGLWILAMAAKEEAVIFPVLVIGAWAFL